ncbi:MAG: tRNA pseudouridine(55) synthase TruB [Candidatus Shapirobacteria bacterium]
MNKPNFFLVYKPAGISSYDVVRYFKNKFPEEKVGHAGTLDPLASGLLIILVGKICKKQGEFLSLDKEYLAKITFGLTSDTYDLGGKVKVDKIKKLTQDQISLALRSFGEKYMQTVPLYSAVKRKGKPLYRYARQGKKLENLPQKQVQIKKINLLSFRNYLFPEIEVKLRVSKGFYVRSFAHDLGEKLGTGAVLSALERTRIGRFYL